VGERYVSAIAIEDLAPGGMKVVQVEGREIVVGNDGGRFYAVERRCGHMNAPLEMGTLVGTVVTCPMHCAQFDVATGEALAGPVPEDSGNETAPPKIGRLLANVGMLMEHIQTQAIRTYATKVDSGMVWIAL
jgi:nitrite reductase/ring-hydroxylating ferredoxin subunit